MPHWGDNIHWDSGAHWAVPSPQPNKPKMAIIALNISGKSLSDRIFKGQDIITKSTGNPNVTGNAAALAALVTAQANLVSSANDEVAARSTVKEKMLLREAAENAWETALAGLAGVTTTLTGGNAAEIVSTGFDIRAAATPSRDLPAPTKVVASLNGTPGHTLLDWEPMVGAKSYIVQISPDPMTATSWSNACTCTPAHADVNGAEPGKRYWYRISAVNTKGQGPWSEPVCRPVM